MDAGIFGTAGKLRQGNGKTLNLSKSLILSIIVTYIKQKMPKIFFFTYSYIFCSNIYKHRGALRVLWFPAEVRNEIFQILVLYLFIEGTWKFFPEIKIVSKFATKR